MENSNSSEKKKCLVWNRRTLLERYLFLVCLLLLIAFLVMIGVLLHLENINKKSKLCLSNVCKREAGSIVGNMDFTVNPCENFYDFACGSYMKYEDIYSEKITTSSNLYNYMIYATKVQLEKSVNVNDPPFFAKVKKYYQSCLNKPTDVKDVIHELLNATELDGWPLSEDYNSRSTMEDAAILSFFYTRITLLFDIVTNGYPSYLSLHNGHSLISLDELFDETEEESAKKKERYIDIINYVFRKLSLPRKDSRKYVEEMIDFETSLAKIQQEHRRYNKKNSTISKLESECPQIKWKNMFKLFFKITDRPAEYNEEYPLIISNMEYINEICNFIGNSNKNKRIIYNMLIWNMVINYLGRFDFTFRELLSEISRSSTFEGSVFPNMKKLKWKTCIGDAGYYFQFGLEYMTIKSMNPEVKIKEVKIYAKNVSEMIREIFSNQDWLDDSSKNILKSKVKNITYYIGYSNISLNEKFLNQVMENISITDNYMQNVLSITKHMTIDGFYNSDLLSYFYKETSLDPYKMTAYYKDRDQQGKLVISFGFLHPPFYSYGLPKYFNYGGLGAAIGHEFSHGFDQLEDLENLSVEFLEEYKRRKNCLVNQYFQFPLEGNLMINGNDTIWDNFADNSGLTVTFRAYERYLELHGDEPYLPGLDYTNRQMFFIIYAQSWCEQIDSAKESFEHDGHSPGKYRVIVPLMNSPEFSKAFDCPLNSYMNPEYKCKIWE